MVHSFLEKIWSLQNWSDTISSAHSISFNLANTSSQCTGCQRILYPQFIIIIASSSSLSQYLAFLNLSEKLKIWYSSHHWDTIHPKLNSFRPNSRINSSCNSVIGYLVTGEIRGYDWKNFIISLSTIDSEASHGLSSITICNTFVSWSYENRHSTHFTLKLHLFQSICTVPASWIFDKALFTFSRVVVIFIYL